MPRAYRAYQQPSRGSRILITLLAVSVVLLAGWIVLSNTILTTQTAPAMVAQVPDLKLALRQAGEKLEDQVGAVGLGAMSATSGRSDDDQATEADNAPPLPEPVVVASAQGVPLPVPQMLPSLASAQMRLIEMDARQPQAAVPDEGEDGVPEVVPLPPRRPKAASIPLPRPRPELEFAADRASSQILSDAEIARMQ